MDMINAPWIKTSDQTMAQRTRKLHVHHQLWLDTYSNLSLVYSFRD
jgi:hypothetical protein